MALLGGATGDQVELPLGPVLSKRGGGGVGGTTAEGVPALGWRQLDLALRSATRRSPCEGDSQWVGSKDGK